VIDAMALHGVPPQIRSGIRIGGVMDGIVQSERIHRVIVTNYEN
jgi:hypothetical protein